MAPFVLYAVLISTFVSSDSDFIQGQCSWNASSDSKLVPASVLTVRLTACHTGSLVWRQPYGGVDISYHSEVPHTTPGQYHVCLTTQDQQIVIFTGTAYTLHMSAIHGNQTREVCVTSLTKHIVVYFESLDTTRSESAVFHYRTSFIRSGHGQLRHKDCKQCSYDELVNSFCAGDFAVQGYVQTVLPINGAGSERGEAVVVAHKIFQQSYSIFKLPLRNNINSSSPHEAAVSGKSPSSISSNKIFGNVNFPLYCRWRKRTKQGFLFTGNIEHGIGPVVKCRMKFSRWKRIYHKDICRAMMTKV